MKRMSYLATAGLFAIAAFTLQAADEKKDEVKCPVSGKAIVKDHAVDFNGGKVYFCCPNCPKAFEKDSAKFAVKANEQLVQTGQAKQAKCPLSGGKLNAEQKVSVAGIDVQFCCMNCKGKVAAATGDEQAKLVFADGPFKKGFEVTAAK